MSTTQPENQAKTLVSRSGLRYWSVRILGLSTYPIHFDQYRYTGKGADLFNNLANHFRLIDLGVPKLGRWEKWAHRLRYARPNRSQWNIASKMNVQAFDARTRQAEAIIQRYETGAQKQYDLIFQLHTMMAPGVNLGARPYVLATDNTYAISDRYWAEWVPLKSARDAWMERERQIYENAHAIFTWSEFARQSIINDYGIRADKITVTGSSGNFRIDPAPKADFSQPIALFVGLDFERKGGYVLLEAWKTVQRQMPEAQLWIVGTKKPLADPIPGVHWKGRIFDRKLLKEMFMQSRAFVLPSLFEPFAMSLLEAMSMGIPCISTNDFGIREMIRHEETGLLVERGNAEALSDALLRLLGDPHAAQQMGSQAHAEVLQRFTWDHVVDKMVPKIERIASALRNDEDITLTRFQEAYEQMTANQQAPHPSI